MLFSQLFAHNFNDTFSVTAIIHPSKDKVTKPLTLLGMRSGTPRLRKARAVSGCPNLEATWIRVLPSLVLSVSGALQWEMRNSTKPVYPRSAAMWRGMRSNCLASGIDKQLWKSRGFVRRKR